MEKNNVCAMTLKRKIEFIADVVIGTAFLCALLGIIHIGGLLAQMAAFLTNGQ